MKILFFKPLPDIPVLPVDEALCIQNAKTNHFVVFQQVGGIFLDHEAQEGYEMQTGTPNIPTLSSICGFGR